MASTVSGVTTPRPVENRFQMAAAEATETCCSITIFDQALEARRARTPGHRGQGSIGAGHDRVGGGQRGAGGRGSALRSVRSSGRSSPQRAGAPQPSRPGRRRIRGSMADDFVTRFAPPSPPAGCTRATPCRRCWPMRRRAKPAAASCYASRTSTSPAPGRPMSRPFMTTSPGWASTGRSRCAASRSISATTRRRSTG